MLSLFNSRPVIADTSAQWLLDCFGWAIQNYDRQAFQQCQLVLPTNEFFPGRVNSVHGMANAIFERVVEYAGMSHWPFTLVRPENFIAAPVPELSLDTAKRHNTVTEDNSHPMRLLVSYLPQQTKQPEAMAASYSHLVAQHLVYQSRLAPPAGEQYLPQATEVVAVFMGFGLLLTNSAYTFRGGCGSCYDPAANRSATLSEAEALFALVIFCELKQIPAARVFKYLKKHLRSTYRRALKQLSGHSQQLEQLHRLIGQG